MITWNPGSELGILKWFLGFHSFGKISGYSLGAKLWKLLRFEFCCTPFEKLIIVPDTNYITSAIWKLMLDIPSPGSYENIGRLIWAQQSSEHVKSCDTNWVKIKGAQLKGNLHHPVVHQMLIKNCKITMMIRCILTELLDCKFHEECLCLLMSTLFRTSSCNNLVRKHQITMVLWQYLISIQCTIGLYDLIFYSDSLIFTWYEPNGSHRLNRLGLKVFGSQTIMMKIAWKRQNSIGNFPAKRCWDFWVTTVALSIPLEI